MMVVGWVDNMSLENSNREVFINGIDYMELESVGSCIDRDGIVYPMNVDGTIDTNCGVDWLETSDEWSESVSEEDCGLLNDWLLEINYSVEVS